MRFLNSNLPIGDRIFETIVFIFCALFVLACVWLIIRMILWIGLSAVEWTYGKMFGYSSRFEDRIEAVDHAIDNIFNFPGKIYNDLREATIDSSVKLPLILNILLGLSIPFIAMLIWLTSYGNPIDKFNLIASKSVVTGYITSIEADSDVVETNDGRTAEIREYYGYEYYFTLPNGKRIIANGSNYGAIPDYLAESEVFPYRVTVRYVPNNPSLSRVEELTESDDSFWNWFRHDVAFGLIVVAICVYLGIIIIKRGWGKYIIGKS